MNAPRHASHAAFQAPPDWGSLLPALRDFERSPGRYRVVLREPRPLFEQIGSVMLLASGRPLEGLPATPAGVLELRRAARFFVRTVMLRPGSDPLTLLGLKPGFEPAQLRAHYRLMIRLTHPDFGVAGEDWPADAATRINRANDRLSSPEKRAEQTAALPRPAWTHGLESAGGGWTPRARLALAGMGAVLVVGAFLLISPAGSEGSLTVQRALPMQERVPPDGRPGSPEPVPGTPGRKDMPP